MATALLHSCFLYLKQLFYSSSSLSLFSLCLYISKNNIFCFFFSFTFLLFVFISQTKIIFFTFTFLLLVVISLVPTSCSWCCTFVSRDHDNSYHTTAKLSIFSSKDRAESQPRILMVFFFFMPVERSSLKKDQILSLRKSKWLDGQLDVRCPNVWRAVPCLVIWDLGVAEVGLVLFIAHHFSFSRTALITVKYQADENASSTRNKRVPFQTSGGCIQINHCTFDPYWCYLSVYQKIEITEIPGWYKTKSAL